MAPLGKYNSVFNTPKIARGISGSETRTMMRNIMLISANAVKQTTTNRRIRRIGSNGIGMPAMRLPTIMIEQPRRDEVVGVVLDERDVRIVLRQHAPRKLRRNRQHAVDAAVAEIVHGPSLIRVLHGVERLRSAGDGHRQLAHAHRRQAAVLI